MSTTAKAESTIEMRPGDYPAVLIYDDSSWLTLSIADATTCDRLIGVIEKVRAAMDTRSARGGAAER